MRTLRITCTLALLVWSGSAVLIGHHSAAGQDFNKRVEIEGVVKVWEIANPHGHVILRVTDQKGARDIEFETHSKNNVYRSGYRDGMIAAGDKIKVMVAPNRDGSDGGYMTGFVTAKGVKVGN